MIQRKPIGTPANPGASAAVNLYDEVKDSPGDADVKAEVQLTMYLDQEFSLYTYWAASRDASAPLRLVRVDTFVNGDSKGYVKAIHASIPITVVAKASLVNNDYFTVVRTDTTNGLTVTKTVVFEYRVDTDFVATADRVAINVTAATTATTVAVATATAIRTAFAEFTVAVPTSEVITVVNTQSGSRFAISATENVANAGFTIGSPTVGVSGTVVNYDCRLRRGRTKIDLVTSATAPTEFDIAGETRDLFTTGGVA